MSRTIDVSDLPPTMVEAIESLVRAAREQAQSTSAAPPAPRPFGWLKGQVEVPDSFFDPLPDDLLDLFEGRGEEESP
jgi:hypothetical protein